MLSTLKSLGLEHACIHLKHLALERVRSLGGLLTALNELQQQGPACDLSNDSVMEVVGAASTPNILRISSCNT